MSSSRDPNRRPSSSSRTSPRTPTTPLSPSRRTANLPLGRPISTMSNLQTFIDRTTAMSAIIGSDQPATSRRSAASSSRKTRPTSATAFRTTPAASGLHRRHTDDDVDTTSIFSPDQTQSFSSDTMEENHHHAAPAARGGGGGLFNTTAGSISLTSGTGSETMNLDRERERQKRFEKMKLPIPEVIEKTSNQDEDKDKKEQRLQSDDSLQELDGEPEGFGHQQQRYDSQEYYDDQEGFPGGYDNTSDHTPEQQQEGDYSQQDHYYYEDENQLPQTQSQNNYEENVVNIKQEFGRNEGGIWSEPDPTISDRGFTEDGFDEPIPEPESRRISAGARFAKKARDIKAASPPRQREKQAQSTSRLGGGFTFNRREPSRVADPPSQKVSAPPPTSAQPQPPKVSFRSATPPSLPAPRRADVSDTTDTALRPIDPTRPLHHRSSTTALISPSMTSTSSLLPDSELRTISTYPELLTALHNRYLSTRSQPPTDMAAELATILNFGYPERNEARPVRFFESLPDDAYEAAGKAILEKKRELESLIEGVGRKKRRIVGERMRGLEEEAERKARRLEQLGEVRKRFQEGVAGLLRQGGLGLGL